MLNVKSESFRCFLMSFVTFNNDYDFKQNGQGILKEDAYIIRGIIVQSPGTCDKLFCTHWKFAYDVCIHISRCTYLGM